MDLFTFMLLPFLFLPQLEPALLFRASQAAWVKPVHHSSGIDGFVTDGPFLFRTKTGKLGMIWTSWVGRDYTMGVAYSKSGTILGPWVQEPRPLTPANYGHGMLFRSKEGRTLLALHSPNTHLLERPRFVPVDL